MSTKKLHIFLYFEVLILTLPIPYSYSKKISKTLVQTYTSAQKFTVPEDSQEVGDEEGSEHENKGEEGGVGFGAPIFEVVVIGVVFVFHGEQGRPVPPRVVHFTDAVRLAEGVVVECLQQSKAI